MSCPRHPPKTSRRRRRKRRGQPKPRGAPSRGRRTPPRPRSRRAPDSARARAAARGAVSAARGAVSAAAAAPTVCGRRASWRIPAPNWGADLSAGLDGLSAARAPAPSPPRVCAGRDDAKAGRARRLNETPAPTPRAAARAAAFTLERAPACRADGTPRARVAPAPRVETPRVLAPPKRLAVFERPEEALRLPALLRASTRARQRSRTNTTNHACETRRRRRMVAGRGGRRAVWLEAPRRRPRNSRDTWTALLSRNERCDIF